MPAAMQESARSATISETCWKPAPGPGAGVWGRTYLQKGKHLGLGTGCWGG